MKPERHPYRKVLFVLAATTLPLLLALLVLLHWYLEREELAEQVMSQASVIAGNAGPAIAFNDKEAAAEILGSLAGVPTVIDAGLFYRDGQLFAGFAGNHPAADPGSLQVHGWRRVSFSLRDLGVEVPVMEGSRMVGFAIVRVGLEKIYRELASFFIGFVIVAFVAGAIGLAATRGLRQRLANYEGELQASNAKLQQLMNRREHIIEEEHKRIAVEIHDEIGQVLTAALLRLRLIEKGLDAADAKTAEEVREVESLLDDAYLGMKNIASSLFPAVIAFGFRPALEWLAERLLAPAQVAWRIEIPDPAPVLEQTQAVALFRIVQEALTNSVRHAHATQVSIALVVESGRMVLSVTDDGAGFDRNKQTGSFGFGLMGIRERAEALGGKADVISEPGLGTAIRVTLPSVGKS